MTDQAISQNSVPPLLVQNGQNEVLHSLLQQLNESQWWSTDQLMTGQLQQLRKLIAYSMLYSSFYRERFKDLNVNDVDFDSFAELPVLTRNELQDNNGVIDCSQVPDAHGEVSEVMTSGSTATPVRLRGTGLTSMIWNAINMREQLWFNRDIAQSMAAIRWRSEAIGMAPDGVVFEDWGMPINQFFKTTPGYYLNSSSNIVDQLQWLTRVKPYYLMSHPSNVKALLQEQQQQAADLSFLGQIRTVGETVSDELRELVTTTLGIPLVDFYSSQELGYVALQCPQQDHYHIQSESVIVEVLRDDNSRCDPFETGKLVVTSLRNYATPLIRYDVGDYGELGEPCDCGRGLPVLKKVNGRVRNMLQLPDGNTHWPNFGFQHIMQVVPLRQFQVVQHNLEQVELKLVVSDSVDSEQEDRIKQILIEHLGHPFEIAISYHSELARSASGKFEDFVSMHGVN